MITTFSLDDMMKLISSALSGQTPACIGPGFKGTTGTAELLYKLYSWSRFPS